MLPQDVLKLLGLDVHYDRGMYLEHIPDSDSTIRGYVGERITLTCTCIRQVAEGIEARFVVEAFSSDASDSIDSKVLSALDSLAGKIETLNQYLIENGRDGTDSVREAVKQMQEKLHWFMSEAVHDDVVKVCDAAEELELESVGLPTADEVDAAMRLQAQKLDNWYVNSAVYTVIDRVEQEELPAQ